MREEFTLALHRESSELEWELIDRRIDEAFAQVYEYLEPAADYLRSVCDDDGCRALDQLERAYLKALEVAARSGLGLRPARKGEIAPTQPQVSAGREAGGLLGSRDPSTGTDSVVHVRPGR